MECQKANYLFGCEVAYCFGRDNLDFFWRLVVVICRVSFSFGFV